MSTATITIGPEHDGQTMSLEDFYDAEVREGYLYELSRGAITVTDVPNEPHGAILDAIREQLWRYRFEQSEEISAIRGGSEAKIPVDEFESERHPDLSIYKTHRPKDIVGSGVWRVWIPELVIEVVSPESADRDYNQKPEEYLHFGVQEYWIVDETKRRMTVHQRSGDEWKTHTVSPGELHTTALFPGLEFNLQSVFDAVDE